jgi:hypothetical protein
MCEPVRPVRKINDTRVGQPSRGGNFMFTRQSYAIVSSLFLVLLIASAPCAQSKADNSLTAGAWALQFEIEDNFDLGSFEGSTISIKKQTSPGSAWRLGLSVAINARVADNVSDILDSIRNSTDNHSQNQSVGVTVHRLWYPSPDRLVNVFIGLGPIGSFSHATTGSSNTSASGRFTKDERESWSWSAGVSGILGVEWFATRNISLLAEYGTVAEYEHIKNERTQWSYNYGDVFTQDTESTSDAFNFSARSVKFGLSVYF